MSVSNTLDWKSAPRGSPADRGARLVMRATLHLLAAYFLVAACAAVAADTPPDTIVKSTVDEVLTVVRQTRDKRSLHDLAEQKVLPHFDFRRMTQFAAGRAWRDANPAQQQALENSFRTLLLNTYTSALSVSASGSEKVAVKPVQMTPGQDDVTVKTTVKDASNQSIAIDYRMAKSSDGWKVYDVVVENLSLVTNYRGTFASEVARSGIDGLIKVLDDKNRGLARS